METVTGRQHPFFTVQKGTHASPRNTTLHLLPRSLPKASPFQLHVTSLRAFYVRFRKFCSVVVCCKNNLHTKVTSDTLQAMKLSVNIWKYCGKFFSYCTLSSCSAHVPIFTRLISFCPARRRALFEKTGTF